MMKRINSKNELRRSKIFTILLLVLLGANYYSLAQPRCNTWLFIGGSRSGVDIGSLGVWGTELTIECLFNRTQPYDPISQGGGDLVSNHCNPTDINYLLRPNSAQIRTSNGFFQATDNTPISLNTTYHVAMVYDGSTLRLYRNGALVAQTAVTGNLMGNAYNTKIGRTACIESPWPTDFIGYINEVKIWSTVRSQVQIQANMYNTLPNPAVQEGLLGYFTFLSLQNKVYPPNTNALTGTFFGPSVNINATNPNLTFNICDSDPTGPVQPPQAITCNTYLNVNGTNSGVTIGDVDIAGNQLTIEAVFNRTQTYNTLFMGGDLVSKHCNPSDVNYFLRPNQGGIRTNNGLFIVNANCPIQLNQAYHIAMVYDGITLRLYRNSELVGNIPATGNLNLNNFPTHIGSEGCFTTNPAEFLGFIDEIRIWNSARKFQSLEKYKFKRLNDPLVQPNLQAYYVFNSLQNLQGNAAFNGTLIGVANINQMNPQCTQYGPNCSCITCRPAPVVNSPVDETATIYDAITPNPAIDFIKFNSSNSISESAIININGVIVKSFKLVKGANYIYVGDLSPGYYILKKRSKGKITLRSFVKV